MSLDAARGSWLVPVVLFSIALAVIGGPTFFTLLQGAEQTKVEARCAARHEPVGADQPARAAALADALWERPDDSDCLLSQHGIDRQQFVALMEAIAADPAASKTYAAQRRTVASAE